MIVMKLKYIVLALSVCAIVCSCDKTSEYASTDRTNIEKYLSSLKIYDRSDYEPDDSGATLPAFYDYLNGVYRYIPNENRDSRTGEATVKGDSVTLYFQAYTFSEFSSYSNFVAGRVAPYYTNRAYLIDRIKGNTNMNWSTDPLKIKLGDGQILSGVERALRSCYVGDSVVVLLPTDQAYGNKPVGVVSQYAPVAFVLSVEDIIKN